MLYFDLVKLIYLPLDSRPIQTQQFQSFSTAWGVELNLPPLGLLGGLEEPANDRLLAKWLFEVAPAADAFLVSVDLLAYGGLIFARLDRATFAGAISRLQILKELRHRYGRPLYAFSLGLRDTISVRQQQDLSIWRALLELEHPPSIFDPFEQWEGLCRGPKVATPVALEPLEAFYKVRRRNFHLQEVLLEWLEEGVFDEILFLQEDAVPAGFHAEENARLKALVYDRTLFDRCSFQLGGDEAPYLLLCRLLDQSPLSVRVEWSEPQAAASISRFEDQPAGEVLKQKLDFLKMEVAPESEVMIYVHARVCQGDRMEGAEAPIPPAALPMEATGAACLLDIAYCNGADPGFAQSWLAGLPSGALRAYAAFNTTANTFGIGLGFLRLLRAKGETEDVRRFFLLRLLDDYVYQALVRPLVQKGLREAGIPFWHFGARPSEANALLQSCFEEPARRLLEGIGAGDYEVSAYFPWNRAFEVGLRLRRPLIKPPPAPPSAQECP